MGGVGYTPATVENLCMVRGDTLGKIVTLGESLTGLQYCCIDQKIL